jgi:predicted ABC-type sugar transport system permease subunit
MTDTAVGPKWTKAQVASWLQSYGVYIAVVLLLLFNLAFTDNFMSVANFRTQLLQAAPVCIVALGMALVIGTEGVDLSVGAVMALSAALIPLYLGYGPVAAVLVALVAGLVAGLFNGFLVAYIGVQPIVATLALLVGGRGLALVIAHGQLIQVHDQSFLALGTDDLFGIPISVLIAAWTIWAVESGRSCLINVARTSCISTAPITVPRMRTRPPVSGVPPTTTAVMAESSISSPMSAGSLAPSRAVASTPAIPANTPHSA